METNVLVSFKRSNFVALYVSVIFFVSESHHCLYIINILCS